MPDFLADASNPSLDPVVANALVRGDHADPFAVLGPHPAADGTTRVRTLQPGADAVWLILSRAGQLPIAMSCRHCDGLFEALLPDHEAAGAYRLRVFRHGHAVEIDDAYRFGLLLGDLDLWLLSEGSHARPWRCLGAHPWQIGEVAGTRFAVWAPNARRVSVIGDFNGWDGRCHVMRVRGSSGIWELFVPGVNPGQRYKYELRQADGHLAPLKADPYALRAELRPATASIVQALPEPVAAGDPGRRAANSLAAPISIYEVHLGSWRRVPEQGDRFLDWAELAEQLIPYAVGLGFTHLELMPIAEFPFDGSWGYQPVSLYAPTARFGSPEGFRRFIERAHAAGLGVLLDWVPGHFPSDAHGLARFDGTPLYEHADPREGMHRDWNTLIYNFGRTEVCNFLTGNGLYWIECFGIDGLRVDAVASMLYRDYSREAGDWIPNHLGGRENLEAIDFLRRMNRRVGVERPEAVTIAEESTAWPMVSRPPDMGGLGFHYKWNMGWMHDTLNYMQLDPVHRKHHHDQLTFGLVYAFNENFVLPLSHDEVVHGKGSLLGRMPGDRWQRFANLRLYFGFMWAHPGKKLLFMGGEFAQEREWDYDRSLDWHLLADALHAGVQRLVRDLNLVYRATPALHQRDFEAGGFEWIDLHDGAQSVLSFVRRGHAAGDVVVVACNFTPVPREGYRLGVPAAGRYQLRINTDAACYGGSDLGPRDWPLMADPHAVHGRDHSLLVTLPPLACLLFSWLDDGSAA